MDEAEKVAYGRLRLKPWEFDEYTIPEFVRAKEGYFEEQEDLYKIILTGDRMVAFTAHRAIGGKSKSPDKFWPLWFDAPKNKKEVGFPTSDLSKEDIKQINKLIQSNRMKKAVGNKKPWQLKHASF